MFQNLEHKEIEDKPKGGWGMYVVSFVYHKTTSFINLTN